MLQTVILRQIDFLSYASKATLLHCNYTHRRNDVLCAPVIRSLETAQTFLVTLWVTS